VTTTKQCCKKNPPVHYCNRHIILRRSAVSVLPQSRTLSENLPRTEQGNSSAPAQTSTNQLINSL